MDPLRELEERYNYVIINNQPIIAERFRNNPVSLLEERSNFKSVVSAPISLGMNPVRELEKETTIQVS
jgi:hypothetical protein